MTEQPELTTRELIGLLPGGWTLADDGAAGGWDDAGKRWTTRLRDGADVVHEVVVEAEQMRRHGPSEAFRRALDHAYRSVVPRGLLG